MSSEWIKFSKFQPKREDIKGTDKFLVCDGEVVWDAQIDEEGKIRDYGFYYEIDPKILICWMIVKPCSE